MVGIFLLLFVAFQLGARCAAGDAQPAAGAHRRRDGRVPRRRRADGRLDHRLHHAVRHRHAQRRDDGRAHPPPGRTRRRARCGRGGEARRRGTAGADTDDRAGRRTGAGAAGAGRRQPGSEIQAPMAVVILFGLVTSTLLNMLVVPALYLRFGAIRHELESGQTRRRRTSDVLDDA